MSKIGVKIFPNIMIFSWKPNRSLSFQFPKLYAIQMPGLLKSVVNFLKNKGIEKVWLVHKKSRKNRPPQQFIYPALYHFQPALLTDWHERNKLPLIIWFGKWPTHQINRHKPLKRVIFHQASMPLFNICYFTLYRAVVLKPRVFTRK